MIPAVAKATESNTLEEVGRATLQIVHDLKNQLNGLKLYATFLRKRLEQDDRATEERATLAKLIAGLDRAARDMTMLVKYAQPLEIRRQSNVDLRKMLIEITRDVSSYANPSAALTCEVNQAAAGTFDAVALSLALTAITEQAIASGNAKTAVAVHLRKPTSQEAVIEWIRDPAASAAASTQSSEGPANVRRALATRIISAHGGRVESDARITRVWLPLTSHIQASNK